MGASPREVDEMSLWEFSTQWKAYLAANTMPAGPKAPSAEDLREAVARHTLH